MEINKLSDRFAVCGQISSNDMQDIKSRGFHALICARPDGEADDQPSYAEIEQAAQAQGLQTVYIPVLPSGATPENHAAFTTALATLHGSILGYCRSGQRAAMLWQAQHVPAT